MRKDVKFGLTIGSILVVTLIVYGIVLTHGGSTPPGKTAIAPAADADGSAANPAPSVDSSTTANNISPGDQPAANPNDVSVPPATQPAAVADSRSDWNAALNSGLPASLSASAPPEHTVTPMIDSAMPGSERPSVAVNRDTSTPVIDPLPTTQPAPQMAAASAPLLEAAVSPAPEQRTHRVAAGESPYSIAASVYGNGSLYTKILAANPGVDPRRMKIGTLLIIPELSDTEKTPSASVSTVEASIDTSTAYKVQSGDTLDKICRRLYDDPGMIGKLYDANQSLIGPDENVLKVGWILKLPQPPSVASAAH
jgi:nucleoid-associated protein YgaU